MVIAPILAKATTAAKVVGARMLKVTTKADTGNTSIASVARRSVKSSGHFHLWSRSAASLFFVRQAAENADALHPFAASPKGITFLSGR